MEAADEFLGGLVSSNSYCRFFYHMASLNMVYQGLDGIGISVMRYLYIKKGTWIKYTFGEMKLLVIIVLVNILVAFLELYVYNIEITATRSMYNICMGRTYNFQVRTLNQVPVAAFDFLTLSRTLCMNQY